jgi:hypothetical protein
VVFRVQCFKARAGSLLHCLLVFDLDVVLRVVPAVGFEYVDCCSVEQRRMQVDMKQQAFRNREERPTGGLTWPITLY